MVLIIGVRWVLFCAKNRFVRAVSWVAVLAARVVKEPTALRF